MCRAVLKRVIGLAATGLLLAIPRSAPADNHITSGGTSEADCLAATNHPQRFHKGDVATASNIWMSCEATDVGFSASVIKLIIPAGLNLTWDSSQPTFLSWQGGGTSKLVGATNFTYSPDELTLSIPITGRFGGSADNFQIQNVGFHNIGNPCQGSIYENLTNGTTVDHTDSCVITVVDLPTGSLSPSPVTIFPNGASQAAPNITVSESPNAGRGGIWKTSGTDFGIRLQIPTGLGVQWDKTITSAAVSDTANVDTAVAYSLDGQTARLTVTNHDFNQNESVTVSGLKFIVATNAADNVVPINILTGPSTNTTVHATCTGTINIRGLPTMHSAASQTFTVGDPSTLAGDITIIDSSGSPKITTTNPIQVIIPAGLNLQWDPSTVLSFTLTGGTQPITVLPYTLGNTVMNLQVGTSNFVAGEKLVIHNAAFMNFSTRTTPGVALQLVVDPALTIPNATDAFTRLIRQPTIQSSSDQIFLVGEGPATLQSINIKDDLTNPAITTNSQIRIRIPTGQNVAFTGPTSTAPNVTSNLFSGVSAFPPSYEDPVTGGFRTLVLTSNKNFAAAEVATVSNIAVTVGSPNSLSNLQLFMSGSATAQPTATDPKLLLVGALPTIASANQQFTTNDPSTGASTVTISTDSNSAASLEGGQDLQILIPTSGPNAVNMEFDTTVTTGPALTLTVGGAGSGAVATSVSYPDVHTLQLHINTTFSANQSLSLAGLKFKNFGASSVGRLALKVTATGPVAASDSFTKSVGSPTIASSGASQVFGTLDPSTVASAITIHEDAVTPRLLAGNQIRIRIPSAIPMTWDSSIAATPVITGPGTGALGPASYFTNGMSESVLAFNITSTFGAGQVVTISNAQLMGFTSLYTGAQVLELEVNNLGGVPNATDAGHSIVIGTRPTLLTATTGDLNGNGSIDQIVLTFNEALSASGLSATTGAGFTVTGYPIIGASLDAPKTHLTLSIRESGLPDTGAIPLVSYDATKGDLADATYGLALLTTSKGSLDGAPPVIINFSTSDANANGHLDSISFIFSETIQGTPDISQWKIVDADGKTNLLASLTSAAMVISGNRLTFNLADTTGTTGTPRYRYTSNGVAGTLGDGTNLLPTSTNNTPPIASAGTAQSVLPSLVTLDASNSRDPQGQPLSFLWNIVSSPVGGLTLSDSTVAKPTFLGTTAGAYKFTVQVSDGLDTSTATTTVTVINVPPNANAGPDQTVSTGTTVVLDGTLSSDANGDALSYGWTLISGPAAAGPYAGPRVTAFVPSVAGLYLFELAVTDVASNISKARVHIRVNGPGLTVPTAVAGPNQVRPVGSLVTLNGTGSSDPDGLPLSFAWTAATPVTLSGAATATPTFTPVAPGLYVFTLTVTDTTGLVSIPDTVSILVFDPSTPPPLAVANKLTPVGIPQVGEVVTLDSTGSLDPSGKALSFAWSQIQGPTAALSNPADPKPTFAPVQPGQYVFQLVVSNGVQPSFPATASFLVRLAGASVILPTITASQVPAPVGHTLVPATIQLNTSFTVGSATIQEVEWFQTGGPGVSLSAPNQTYAGYQNPTFSATVPGVYSFEVWIWDGNGSLEKASVTVIADTASNQVPTANAGSNQTATTGQTITLDASASTDDSATFTNGQMHAFWSQLTGAPVALSDPYAEKPTFTPSVPGFYVFSLQVSDGTSVSTASTVLVTVTAAAGTGGGGGGGGGGGCGLLGIEELAAVLASIWLISKIRRKA